MLYANASGNVQFIELTEGSANGESFWQGVTLTATRDGVTHSFSFPSNLPGTNTANTSVLIATRGIADLGIVTPDFIGPAGFLFAAGGTLDFGGADQVTYGALPGDGVSSVNRSGVTGVASPKNFAGASGTLPGTGTPPTHSTPATSTSSAWRRRASSSRPDAGAGAWVHHR